MLAALLNALHVIGKQLEHVRIVVSGAGAAGSAITRLLLGAGAQNITLADIGGVVHAARSDLDTNRVALAAQTNPRNLTGTLREALVGADVFIGVSAPNILSGSDIATMAQGAVVFALANPDPEVDPGAARQHAAIVAKGRSDEPNQIDNVLVFPGVFRGLLDAGATSIGPQAQVQAARALAGVLTPDQLNAAFIIPGVFDTAVTPAVAAAVRAAVSEQAVGPQDLVS